MIRTKVTFNAHHALALFAVKDGADVISRVLALRLREVEAIQPSFLRIVKPKTSDRDPYFGVKPTKKGIQAAEYFAAWGFLP